MPNYKSPLERHIHDLSLQSVKAPDFFTDLDGGYFRVCYAHSLNVDSMGIISQLNGLILPLQASSPSLSLFVGVAVSFLSAVLIYIVRQSWERRKLHKALLTEVEAMEGIDICAEQMQRIDPPPARQLTADDVPAAGSIPTSVYEGSSSRLGLLGSPIRRAELAGVVKFYSKVLRYKSIIQKIGDSRAEEADNNGGNLRINPVSDSDQEDLYNQLPKLQTIRSRILESRSFDVEYPDEID